VSLNFIGEENGAVQKAIFRHPVPKAFGIVSGTVIH